MRKVFILDEKKTVITLRWLIILALIFLMLQSRDYVIFQSGKWILLIYFITNVGLSFFPSKFFRTPLTHILIFIVDIILVSLAIYVTEGFHTDFYLIYFLVVFLAALGREIKVTIFTALVSSLIYLFLWRRIEGSFSWTDANFLIRIPFFFIVALSTGFLSQEGSREKIEKEEMATLLELSYSLSSTSAWGNILDQILEKAPSRMKICFALLSLYTEEGNLEVKQIKKINLQKRIEEDVSLEKWNECLSRVTVSPDREIEIIHSRDYADEWKILQTLEYQLNTLVLLPLIYAQKIIGILILGMKREWKESQDRIKILPLLASIVARAVINAWFFNRVSEFNERLAQEINTATKELEEANRNLKELSEYSDNILKSIASGVVVINQEGIVTTFNREAERLFGYPAEQIIGSSLKEIKGAKALLDLMIITLRNGHTRSREEIYIMNREGHQIPVGVTTSVLRSSGNRTLGSIAIFRDLSLIKQLQMQLIRSERFSALGELAAGMAHEIRNPLTAIRGFSQLLDSKLDKNDDKRRYTQIVISEVDRMNKMVQNVLDFVRETKPELQKLDINDLLSEALTFIEKAVPLSQEIHIYKNLDSSIPLLLADRQKLKQVFLNLFVNALEAMPSGGELSVTTSFEKLMRNKRAIYQDWIRIEVRDTGVGINSRDLEKIFEPFFTTKTQGTGLGLSISKKIIEAHGGNIQVSSELGKGTSFIILLPVIPENPTVTMKRQKGEG